MTFGSPAYLYGLILVPVSLLFLIWADRQRQRAIARMGEPQLIDRLSLDVNTRGRKIKAGLWLTALALLLISLARPQWGETRQTVTQKGVQVMVVLDTSKSMLVEDIKPDRLTRAKMDISELMNRLNGDEVGLTVFSGASFTLFPLTSDYNTARSFLDIAQPGIVSRPGTAIGDAIRTAMLGFDDARDSQKVIVLMTDGEDDPSAMEQPPGSQAGAMIHAVGFGSDAGDVIPELRRTGAGNRRQKRPLRSNRGIGAQRESSARDRFHHRRPILSSHDQWQRIGCTDRRLKSPAKG
jgi:Ca-activated chloride channel family protein